jgi:type 1 glutamine amidotransferase
MNRPHCRFLTAAALALLAASLLTAVPGQMMQAQGPAEIQPLAKNGEGPVRALLVVGGCCHDYKVQKDILAKGIADRGFVRVTIAYDPDDGRGHKNPVYNDPNWAKDYDVVIHDECSSDVKDMADINRILEPHRHGLPAVVLHCGMHTYRTAEWPKVTPWFEFTGLQSTAHAAQKPITVTYVDRTSPITKDLEDWTTIKEELYNNSAGKLLETAHPLARGKQTIGKKTSDYVVAWTNLYRGKTRVFSTTLGHNNETVADPRYLDLVTRGLLWSVNKLDAEHVRPPSRALPSRAPAQAK